LVGSFLMLSSIAIIILSLGARLLGPRTDDLSQEEVIQRYTYRKKMMKITGVASVLLFIAGFACNLYFLRTSGF